MARIVVGVGGGIAAYKVPGLVREFTEAGHHVDVIPTESALNFVGAATWEALSHNPVRTSVFEAVDAVNHVRLGQEADLVVVAPATADLLARVAAGRADDLLTATILTTTSPVYMAPAMHTEMWLNPATQANVSTLRSRGIDVPDPAVGRLTGKDSGPGRLEEIPVIAQETLALLDSATPHAGKAPLAGVRALVSAGGTREPLDPVRFLGNRSTGRQGVAVAEALRDAGAEVELVAANIEVPAPDGVEVTSVTTAAELEQAMRTSASEVHIVVMAAAVADFRPKEYVGSKIKKNPEDDSAPVIELVRNPDILKGLVEDRRSRAKDRRAPEQGGQQASASEDADVLPRLIVGFAAETGDENASVLEYGRAKLQRKGADLLVVNEVSETRGFGTPDNTVVVLAADGEDAGEISGSKRYVSEFIVDAIVERLAR